MLRRAAGGDPADVLADLQSEAMLVPRDAAPVGLGRGRNGTEAWGWSHYAGPGSKLALLTQGDAAAIGQVVEMLELFVDQLLTEGEMRY